MPNLIHKNISLKEYSNIKIGGEARYFLEFRNIDELKTGLAEWEKIKSIFTTPSPSSERRGTDRIFVISGATNILFDDAGFDGLILKNSISYIKKNDDNLLEVGAGTSVKELNDYCIANSLSGIEWSGGLPGSVGGAVFGNAGAFGGETKDSVVEVESFDFDIGQIIKRDNSDCQFDYRQSIFKLEKLPEVILSAKIQFKPGNKTEIAKLVEEHLDYRKLKQPLEYPNIGSIFKNVPVQNVPHRWQKDLAANPKMDPFPVVPAARLIARANMKGKRRGGAMISLKHTNFIVNVRKAKAADVKYLVKFVQRTIKRKFGIELEPEVQIL